MSEKERDNNRTERKRNVEGMEEYTKPAIGLTAPLKKMPFLCFQLTKYVVFIEYW